MRKKQLLLQNSALFAEIERKSGEIEALNIKIEELSEAMDILKAEKDDLTGQLEALQKNNEALLAENELLKNQSTDKDTAAFVTVCDSAEPQADTANEQPRPDIVDEVEPSEAPEPAEENEADNTTLDTLAALQRLEEAVTKAENLPDEPEDEIHTEPTFDPTADPITESKSAKETTLTEPEADLLRAYGAQLIGKITRITAKLISSAEAGSNAEAVKNLALGKNESFKYQILSLISKGGKADDIKVGMNKLADETAEYLNGLKAMNG